MMSVSCPGLSSWWWQVWPISSLSISTTSASVETGDWSRRIRNLSLNWIEPAPSMSKSVSANPILNEKSMCRNVLIFQRRRQCFPLAVWKAGLAVTAAVWVVGYFNFQLLTQVRVGSSLTTCLHSSPPQTIDNPASPWLARSSRALSEGEWPRESDLAGAGGDTFTVHSHWLSTNLNQ